VGLLFAVEGSWAGDAFPTAPVKIIVPNPAGGTADILPRIIADALGSVWKQAVVVENRAGAAGNIGAEAFARAPADGYTLLASPPTTLAIITCFISGSTTIRPSSSPLPFSPAPPTC
jgi:tripartite-type tricarboxylate transporter receptor subunit TctC